MHVCVIDKIFFVFNYVCNFIYFYLSILLFIKIKLWFLRTRNIIFKHKFKLMSGVSQKGYLATSEF